MLVCAFVDGDLIDRLAAALPESPVAGVVSVYLFGSHVSGRTHKESDVDLGVLFNRTLYPTRPLRFDARIRLAAYVVRTLRANDVDLVGLDDAPPTLVRRVMTDGRRLFCTEVETDHAARRTALSRAADLEPFLRRTRRIKLDAIAR